MLIPLYMEKEKNDIYKTINEEREKKKDNIL